MPVNSSITCILYNDQLIVRVWRRTAANVCSTANTNAELHISTKITTQLFLGWSVSQETWVIYYWGWPQATVSRQWRQLRTINVSFRPVKCRSFTWNNMTLYQQAVWPPGSANTVCPRPSVTLTFNHFTLKLVCESHVRWRTSIPNVDTLHLWILELFAMYVTDRQTDRPTEGWTDKSNAYCPLPYSRRHNKYSTVKE